MTRKPCGRHGCLRVIEGRSVARRLFCSRLCANRARREQRLHGHHEKALWRACQQVMQALEVSGEPSLALIHVVRRVRHRAYQAGWTVVQRKVQRAVKRGVLIQRKKITPSSAGV